MDFREWIFFRWLSRRVLKFCEEFRILEFRAWLLANLYHYRIISSKLWALTRISISFYSEKPSSYQNHSSCLLEKTILNGPLKYGPRVVPLTNGMVDIEHICMTLNIRYFFTWYTLHLHILKKMHLDVVVSPPASGMAYYNALTNQLYVANLNCSKPYEYRKAPHKSP